MLVMAVSGLLTMMMVENEQSNIVYFANFFPRKVALSQSIVNFETIELPPL